MSKILREKEINEFIAKLNEVYKELKDERFIVQKLNKETNTYITNIGHQESKSKKFTIGIVGQVKAGKSSFLNSLFFNGKNILPKAATPMTAALTKICYSDKVSAKVYFFSENEWEIVKTGYETAKHAIEKERENINKRLKEKGKDPSTQSNNSILNFIEHVSEVDKSFFEMYESFEHSKDKKNILERLKNEFEELDCSSIDDLKEKLGTYVGVGGVYTSIVKYVEVFVNIEEIKNFDIVDTPGLNDPVISRGQTTRKFLGECDVVFLLSSSGQFLDSNDIGLFSEQLEEKGVSEKVVVGTKFDSAIIGEAKNYNNDLERTVSSVKKKLDDRVIDILKTNERINLLENHSSLYISATCYNIGLKNEKELDEEEKLVKENLNNTFPKGDFSKEGLKKLSSIERFKTEIIPDIKKNKNNILKERLKDLSDGIQITIKNIISKELEEVKESKNNLETADIGKLKEEMKNSEKKLSKIKVEIAGFFDDEIHSIKLKLDKVEKELTTLIQSNDLSIKTKQEQVSRSVKKEGFKGGWDRFWGGVLNKDWGYKTEYSTKTKNYVKVLDVIKQVDSLVTGIQNELEDKFRDVIDIQKITDGALNILKEKELIDFESDNFDAQIFRILKRNLQNISLSKVEFKKDYSKNIEKEFGSVYETEEIGKMEVFLYNTLKEIIKDLNLEISKESEKIIEELMNQSKSIIDNLSSDIEKSINDLEVELKDKEKNIAVYENAIICLESLSVGA